MSLDLIIDPPNAKQRLFLADKHKYVAFGGARGGGKSWAVRTKAKLLCLNYPQIRVCIIRKTYPELKANHIDTLTSELYGVAKYKANDHEFIFINDSTLSLRSCQTDTELTKFQGSEYDVVFIDEATQFSEDAFRALCATVRGVNNYPKRVYLTCNPGGVGHSWVKRLFIDKHYNESERPEDYSFIQSLVTDNKVLMESSPEYVAQLEALNPKLRKAWLEGDWDIFEGQFFEEFRDDPAHYKDRQWTHVIEPFNIPRSWNVYRSYDFGYNKPFSSDWWAVDHDGTAYLILQFYGTNGMPNEGLKWEPDQQFAEIARIEREHPYLKGRDITGVADPSIWDTSRGESIQEAAVRHGIYYTPGDNKRIPGWMQCHYRLAFDENGYPNMYVFNTCKAFIRTIPLLQFSESRPEDLDTEQEDHCADSWRYFCMSRPIKPPIHVATPDKETTRAMQALNLSYDDLRRY